MGTIKSPASQKYPEISHWNGKIKLGNVTDFVIFLYLINKRICIDLLTANNYGLSLFSRLLGLKYQLKVEKLKLKKTTILLLQSFTCDLRAVLIFFFANLWLLCNRLEWFQRTFSMPSIWQTIEWFQRTFSVPSIWQTIEWFQCTFSVPSIWQTIEWFQRTFSVPYIWQTIECVQQSFNVPSNITC